MTTSHRRETQPDRPLRWSDIRSEIRPTLALGWPVVVGQLGFMLMNAVDTAMVKPLGAEATAAVGLGSGISAVTFMFGMGLLLGLDRVVSYAFGAGRYGDCRQALVQGLWIATAMAIPITALMQVLAGSLELLGVDPAIAPTAGEYLRALSWSTWPGLLFTAFRQTLQAVGDTRVPSAVMLLANLVNVAANQVFIFGGLGIPEMGAVGAGWATFASRMFMFALLAAYTLRRGIVPESEQTSVSRVDLRPDGPALRELFILGLPVAFHLVLEGGVFTAATLLAARIGTVELAAHHVVLLISSLTFMVPLGLSTAGAVRVGQALGRGDRVGARSAGWGSVATAVMIMGGIALLLLGFGGAVLGVFAADPEVIALGRRLLVLVAVFQMADGAQVTLSSVLRGTGDTRIPAIANFFGHWTLGLPLGATLCFAAGWGTLGLWTGLATGLVLVAAMLTWWWRRRIDEIVGGAPLRATEATAQ